MKKLLAAQEKEKRKAEVAARLEKEKQEREGNDFATANYGGLPLNQSSTRSDKKWTEISSLSLASAETRFLIRARVHNVRGTGKQAFLVLRQREETLQGICSVDESNVSKGMVKFITNIPKESVVDVEGRIVKVEVPVESCTQHDIEILVDRCYVVSQSNQRLPISLDDASRPEDNGDAPTVNLDTKLNNRVIDLRTITNQSIFRIQSAVCQLFREFLGKHGFMEIHSPKMISAASEGGANVFKINYFKGEAFLAQSPQFYKQMAICADFNRVFEIAPVFRAEDSNTHRHMTEFTGLDMEMAFNEHYHEVLYFLADLMMFVFKELEVRFSKELNLIRCQYPSEPFKFSEKPLILPFSEGVKLLREAGVEMGDFDDLSTANEKFLGKIIREKYDTDFYVLDKFPLAIRPFYTMPNGENPNYSNSYDFFMRGEEILSGAQRLHDYDKLVERANEHKIGFYSFNLQI